MEKTLLEVGDIVYASKYGSFYQRYTITRVTPKRAFAAVNDVAETEFRRELINGNVREIGRDTWGPSYSLETPQLKAKYSEQIDRNKLSQLLEKSAKWPIEKVRAMLETISNYDKALQP